jgi:sigma cross-reacting protein 27A (SCRP-27A)
MLLVLGIFAENQLKLIAMSKKRFAVLLSGCGQADGSEIQEAVLLLLAIAEAGGEYHCFAPDAEQHEVINHRIGQPMPDRRNIIVEAARISRGVIAPLEEYKASDYDALVLPGGLGAVKNLCTYAMAGANATIRPEVKKAICDTHALHKPIGAVCIAPMVVALALRQGTITFGDDNCEAATTAKSIGMIHAPAEEREVVLDEKNLIFTTPCNMRKADIVDIAESSRNLIARMMEHMQ